MNHGAPRTDRALRDGQYGDRTNLAARQSLHARFSTHPEPWPRWVFAALDLPADAAVLELGCGPATLWASNRERIPAGWRLALSDFSRGMLRDARRALGDLAGRCRFAQIDAQAIPFPAASLDAVIAGHMLYHVPDRRRALTEIARVLRPGGRLYAATNGPAHLAEIDDLIAALSPRQPRVNQEVARQFGLESAWPLLRERFAEVELRRYEDALVVTEAEALVAYVASVALEKAPSAEDLAALRARIAAEIGAHGAFRVRKETGLFVARRA